MEHKKFMKKNIDLFKGLVIILGILFITLTVFIVVNIQNTIKEGKYISQNVETRNTITVSETGEVYIKPDIALTTFSVTTEAKTVSIAMSENVEKMNAIIKSVKDEGVESKDLKTINFNIYPRYEWIKEECDYPCPSGKRVLVGYEVHQSLNVKIRDIDNVSSVIQNATNAGASQVGDLRFTIDDQDAINKQAREQAINKAKDKAKELASQLGVSLVKIIDFNEYGADQLRYGFEKMDSSMGGGELEIEVGENKVTITVSITYEIN